MFTPEQYETVGPLLRQIHAHQSKLSLHEVEAMRKMVIAGNLDGARVTLAKLLVRRAAV